MSEDKKDLGGPAALKARGARFTILADSEDGPQDYIILDIPKAQLAQVFEKVQQAHSLRDAPDVSDDSLICVYLEVEPHHQHDSGMDGKPTWPPSLLRDDIPRDGPVPVSGQENGNRPPPDDHPGGPLSRAERVVLSNLKGGTMRARAIVGGLTHILGAVPGAQKIEAAQAEAVAAIDRLLATMKQRKEGAPYPADQAPPSTPAASEKEGA